MLSGRSKTTKITFKSDPLGRRDQLVKVIKANSRREEMLVTKPPKMDIERSNLQGNTDDPYLVL